MSRKLFKLMSSYSNVLWMLDKDTLNTMTNAFLKILNDDKKMEIISNDSIEDSSHVNENLYEVKNGIGILSIEDVLMFQASGLRTLCGFVGTIDLHENFLKMEKDESVERILLYFNSPGGEMTGIFEFQETINNSKKEVIAFSDTMIASAAYVLASAANKIIVTPSTRIGSIGVYQQILKEKENTSSYVTHLISAGKYKTFGAPIIPLREGELEYFQAQVDRVYNKMIASIATCRGVTEDIIKNTEAALDVADAMPALSDKIVNNKFNFLEEEYGII
jgi:ClpP class serine protease